MQHGIIQRIYYIILTYLLLYTSYEKIMIKYYDVLVLHRTCVTENHLPTLIVVKFLFFDEHAD